MARPRTLASLPAGGPLEHDYDFVVIGAGLGGLSAAASLAKKGFSVRVLERHIVPGGYATSFVRGRYEFEVSLHVLSDIGSPDRPGGLQRFLRDLGAWDDVEFAQVPDFSRSIFPGLDIRLPMHPEGFTEAICAAFPASAAGVRRFMGRVLAVAREADGLSEAFGRSKGSRLLRMLSIPLRMRAMPRYAFTLLKDVLERDVPEEGARALLCQGWSYVGLPPSDCSFLYYAAMLGSLLNHGGWYPRMRSQGLSSALSGALESHGGSLQLGCGVRRILTEGKRVVGVEDDEGNVIRARAVVSNAGPIVTYQLVGHDKVPRRTLEGLNKRAMGTSIFQVYLGIDRPVEDLGLDCHEVMANDGFDIEAQVALGRTLRRPGHMLIGCPNLAVPGISPPGTSTVTLTSMVRGEPWLDVAPPDYVATKTRFAEGMLGWADELFPGLRRTVEVVEVGSPITMARYTGHPTGAIYGFDSNRLGHTALRPAPVGPLRGLYHVGAWTNPGGGYWPAIASGQIVGEIAASIVSRTAA
ncbi:MAG: NAD(P)/FAD-dependent oxidoreductase [Deltaproteobacteria bacterium]|nr:NAD(P)/FAD-dependent oxidoreductase [Deltaproteobacteria bacterium]